MLCIVPNHVILDIYADISLKQNHVTCLIRLCTTTWFRSIGCKELGPLSNNVERLVRWHQVHFLEQYGLHPRLVYQRFHNSDTVVLKIVSDALSTLKKCEMTLLSMLDLSTALDMADHNKLVDWLENSLDVFRQVLSWITSSVWQQTKKVVYNGN